MQRAVSVVMLVIAAAACAAGCGDDGTSAAEKWARAVCAEQQSYQGRVGRLADESERTRQANPNDLTAQRQALLTLLDGAVAETAKALERLDGIGAPDVDGGAAAQDALVGRYESARSIFGAARAAAQAAPTDDPAAFMVAVTAVAESIGAAFAQQSGSLRDVATSAELEQALAGEPTCGG